MNGGKRQNLIMLAHGTGMAPLLSIIERASKINDENRSITLIQGVRDQDEVFGKEILDNYFANNKQSHWVLACSREVADTGYRPHQVQGHVQDVLRAAKEI